MTDSLQSASTVFDSCFRSIASNRYVRLFRLHAPIPIFLQTTPCLLVMISLLPATPSIALFLKIIIGSITMRTLGCLVNDIIDENFDKEVPRTKNRPIASGEIKLKEALLYVLFLAIIAGGILVTLDIKAIIAGLLLAAMTAIYPLTKRFFPIPQVFLGITFNGGAILTSFAITASTSASSQVTPAAAAIYLGSILWTIGYDTLYAFQDLDFDKKLNLKSSAVAFKDPKQALIKLYDFTIMAWIIAGTLTKMKTFSIYCILIFFVWLLLRWQVKDFETGLSQEAYKKLFNRNLYVALLMLVASLLGKLIVLS